MAGNEHDAGGDQLACRHDSLLSLAIVVGNENLDGLAEQAAGRVDLGHRHRDAALVLLAEPRHAAGQGRRCPDADLGVRG